VNEWIRGWRAQRNILNESKLRLSTPKWFDQPLRAAPAMNDDLIAAFPLPAVSRKKVTA
jgi:hypothetical protein